VSVKAGGLWVSAQTCPTETTQAIPKLSRAYCNVLRNGYAILQLI